MSPVPHPTVSRAAGARHAAALAALAALAAVTLPDRLAAQEPAAAPTGPPTLYIPIALEIGAPQGEFAENVDVTGGIGGGVLVRLGGALALRGELGVMIYGSETRTVPLGNGPLGRITVDVTTTNTIFGGGIGLQLGVPARTPRPYVGGTIGFSNFSTTSSVKGSNSSDEEFASSENYSDVTFAKNALAGVYIPLGGGRAMFDLGVRYTWNGEEVRYLTEGDIVDNPDGPPTITPRRTRADLLTFRVGVTLGVGK